MPKFLNIAQVTGNHAGQTHELISPRIHELYYTCDKKFNQLWKNFTSKTQKNG